MRQRLWTLPPVSFFLTSAFFHYFGPSLAVLLFAHVEVLGVAWLRLASAATILAVWRRPWRFIARLDARQHAIVLMLGVSMAAMNSLFYLALDRLPLATVGAIEFLGTIVMAALGIRTIRNLVALLLAVGGVVALADVRLADEPVGFALAAGNCVGFTIYIILSHRIANWPRPTTRSDVGKRARASNEAVSGIDQLAAGLCYAAVLATPLGIGRAAPALQHPTWILWGVGVGVCSSVIPYVSDQLALARLSRSSFALMLSILPATAAALGLVLLDQIPTTQDLLGIALVILGVGLHKSIEPMPADPSECPLAGWGPPT